MSNVRVIKLDLDVIRAVFTTDWHTSERPPGRRAKSYREEILAKIQFAIDYANGIKAISLCGGDIYHTKEPKNVLSNSHALQTRLEETLRRAMFQTVFGVHGNHDLLADRVDSIPTQPIGALIASGAFTDLSSGSVVFENRDGSVRVQIDAYPYTNDDMEALDRVLNAAPREENVTYRVVLMHQYGDPGDAPMMFKHPTIGFNRMADCDYDLALWGHDHSRTEPVTVGNCTHIRLGSLSRASLAEDEVDRPINAAVFAFTAEQIKFKELPLPAKPLEAAFAEGNRAVEKVNKSDDVTKFFSEMDAIISGGATFPNVDGGEGVVFESLEPRDVVIQLCAGDKPLEELALGVCGL